ncbi:MAG: transporter [Pirellulales bacterium]
MKLHMIVFCVALCLVGPLARGEEAPDAIVAPTEELVLPEVEFERPSTMWGRPLTLMQWSYGDGADCDGLSRRLESDRPYFTKSASVVGLGVWQLETGYRYGREKDYGNESFSSFPDAGLRIGALAEWFEFRLGWTYLVHESTGGLNIDGASDPYVGIKIALTPQDEMLPEMAVLIDTNMSLERNEMEPGVDFIYRWWLNDRWSMGGSSEFRRVSLRRRDSAIGFAQSWIFERAIGDVLTGYAEWAMISVDTPPDPDTQQYIDGGLLYLLTDDVQFDVSIGYGLNQLAMDYFCGFGVTIRR